MTRRFVGALACLLLPLAVVTALAGPASAEDGYRYWNYFHLDGDAWAFAETGPADHKPEDGAVEGFRFGTSTASQGIEPRADLGEVDFDAVCAGTEAADGQKRVAVLIDYGTEEKSGTPPEPRAECAAVAQDASTQKLLAEVAQLRLEGGMLCAVDGYPASGCGDPVPDADIPANEEPVSFALPAAADSGSDSDTDTGSGTSEASATEDGGTPWGLVGLAALVVLIGAGAFALTRRSKSA